MRLPRHLAGAGAARGSTTGVAIAAPGGRGGGSSKKLMILPTNNAVIARDKLTSLNLLRTTDKLRMYAVQCVLVRMP